LEKAYLKSSIEELVENPVFISWILHGRNHKEWESFLNEHPEFKPTARKAQKIVELLRDRQDNLSEDEILNIWKNIEKFDSQFTYQRNYFSLKHFLRYAAILLFALVIGASGLWFFHKDAHSYRFATDFISGSLSNSHLKLTNGTIVELEKENSKVVMNSDKKIIINNEKVINLSTVSSPDISKLNEVIVPVGKKSHLILEDGTSVWLNAGSKMAFPTKFDGKKREVYLDGEAYFEVAHNQDKPFFVNTENISIKVLGTKFNISAYKTDELAETVLLEGSVAVSEKSVLGYMMEKAILSPNQKASYNRNDRSISVVNVQDVDISIAWIEGMFRFSQQSLHEVLNKLQRYYNVQFIYDHEFSTSDLITGKLDLNVPLEKSMRALADVANLQIEIKDGNVYIKKK